MIAAVLGSFFNSFLLRHIFMLFEAHAETDSIFETGVWDNVTSTFYIPYVGWTAMNRNDIARLF